MGKFTTNFPANEFACKCGCGFGTKEEDVSQDLIDLLEYMRVHTGPIHINSGCRCEKWNEAVGGSPVSAHTKGNAADIRTLGSKERFKAVSAACLAGCLRIGIGDTFIHVDVDPNLPKRVIWLY